MGLMNGIINVLFGGSTNVVRDTVQVFRENAEAGAIRNAGLQEQAMEQFATEFAQPRQGGFDRFMDGINRLPRPALALGTLALFIAAMVDPLWFAARMQGIALVPEPMWWLLGVIVSFYFGARHQIKNQRFQKELATSMARVPEVMRNISELRDMRAATPGVADTGPDAQLSLAAVDPGDNPALESWRLLRRA